MQRLANVGNLNEPISEERPSRTAARLPTGAVGGPSIFLDTNFFRAAAGEVTVGVAPPQLVGETLLEPGASAVSPSQWRVRRRWLLDTNVYLDAFAGSGAFIAGSYSRATHVRKALDIDIVTTTLG